MISVVVSTVSSWHGQCDEHKDHTQSTVNALLAVDVRPHKKVVYRCLFFAYIHICEECYNIYIYMVHIYIYTHIYTYIYTWSIYWGRTWSLPTCWATWPHQDVTEGIMIYLLTIWLYSYMYLHVIWYYPLYYGTIFLYHTIWYCIM